MTTATCYHSKGSKALWRIFGVIAVVAVIIFSSAPKIALAASINLPYSGRLVEDDGKPLDGPVDVVVEFFATAESDESLAGPYVYSKVTLDSGVFQINLNLDTAEFHQVFQAAETPAWIQITDATHGITYPRQLLGMAPVALKVPVDGATIGWNAAGQLEMLEGASVSRIGGQKFETTGAAPGQVLAWDNNTKSWKPSAATAGGSITHLELATSSVTSDKLASSAVTDSKVAANAISETKIAGAAVSTSKIRDDAVTTAKIVDGAIISDKLASGAVTTAKIADGAISTTKIADTAVAPGKLAHNCTTGQALKIGSDPSTFDCETVGGGGGDVFKSGNAATAPMELGTTTNHPLHLKANDTVGLSIISSGDIGIGTPTPNAALDVAGASGIRAQQICDESGSNCKDISGGWGGDGTVTSVAITGPSAGIDVTGGPVTGDGTFSLGLTNDLAAVEDLSGTGITVRTGIDTWGTITDNSTDWDLAHTDRLKWDGSATGLDAAVGRSSLGLQIGSDVQAYDAQLTNFAGLIPTADNFIMGNGTNFGLVTGSAARSAIGAAASGANSDITSLSNLDNNSISGDKLSGGTIDTFASTGIDDNAAATAVTIDATGQVGVGTALPNSPLEVAGMVHSTSGGFKLPDGTIIDEAGDIGGSTTSALIQNWPDAIVCDTTIDGISYNVPHFLSIQYSSSNKVIYRYIHSGSDKQIIFDLATGAYTSQSGWSTVDCTNKSISTLISEGKAKYFGNDIATVASDDDGDTKIMVEKTSDEDAIRFDTAGSEKMTIAASGNVGIGTSSPSETLHVEGSVRIANGTEGLGKILTSDSNGIATWQSRGHSKLFSGYGNTTGTAFSSTAFSAIEINEIFNSNPTYSAFTITEAGRYDLSVSANICAPGVSGSTGVLVMVNSTIKRRSIGPSGMCSGASVRHVALLSVGDTLKAQCQQNAGHTANCYVDLVKLD